MKVEKSRALMIILLVAGLIVGARCALAGAGATVYKAGTVFGPEGESSCLHAKQVELPAELDATLGLILRFRQASPEITVDRESHDNTWLTLVGDASESGVLTLQVSETVASKLSPTESQLLHAELVYTFTSLPGVDRVQVNGLLGGQTAATRREVLWETVEDILDSDNQIKGVRIGSDPERTRVVIDVGSRLLEEGWGVEQYENRIVVSFLGEEGHRATLDSKCELRPTIPEGALVTEIKVDEDARHGVRIWMTLLDSNLEFRYGVLSRGSTRVYVEIDR